MTVVVPIAILLALVVAEEIVRWLLRPEARRLRIIKRIGRQRED